MNYPPVSELRTKEAAELYDQLVDSARTIREHPGTPVVVTRENFNRRVKGAARIAWELDLELTAHGKGTPRERRPE